ncbi:hypothetical protein PTSG_08675 [Salpingoeca rosetta]|uniref:BZIP domain-containing protein n=1 Tax=Salpingoeca rosetta (strain ATCC 50818 / BSB-021) TaxID=946362 RepID=F2UKC9_SALR5|nr:uncharacterized protein PTSG_08675 [Salpingoeca rosetta]EGD77578.1 hypothetical protein PTSG_08675 [Salpingoeca rosetta]|eukprot:XP_004990466.1 hypothetical protein PTSG_08675 [Salpingoeca rosetta]
MAQRRQGQQQQQQEQAGFGSEALEVDVTSDAATNALTAAIAPRDAGSDAADPSHLLSPNDLDSYLDTFFLAPLNARPTEESQSHRQQQQQRTQGGDQTLQEQRRAFLQQLDGETLLHQVFGIDQGFDLQPYVGSQQDLGYPPPLSFSAQNHEPHPQPVVSPSSSLPLAASGTFPPRELHAFVNDAALSLEAHNRNNEGRTTLECYFKERILLQGETLPAILPQHPAWLKLFKTERKRLKGRARQARHRRKHRRNEQSLSSQIAALQARVQELELENQSLRQVIAAQAVQSRPISAVMLLPSLRGVLLRRAAAASPITFLTQRPTHRLHTRSSTAAAAAAAVPSNEVPDSPGTVVVTGGSHGIGQAVVRAFAQRGHTVFNLDITQPDPDSGGEDAPLDTTFFSVDMADEDAVRVAFDIILAKCGSIDVLVNNVGIQPPASCVPLHELPTHLWRQVLSVNLDSMYFASKAALPAMLKRDLSSSPSFTGSRGVIVNMASVQGVLSQPGVPAYAASKGAMLSLTRQMALEYGPNGIRVTAVNPGTTATPLVQALIEGDGKTLEDAGKVYPLEQRVAQPSEVGEVAYFLATPAASFISGSHVDVDGAICVKGGWNT